ncbi:hypothetical protein R5W24_004384 [Gemmata sp. JC717]|uniref:hypothetical protein n=1 Tax=Gemmata algarum TaxID=2975278 RepID=UPI0021BB8B0B|nr:hypothetical protein [Gemmata algarum]MDY3555245.1 hypothetical protein [Gemmata algarum]
MTRHPERYIGFGFLFLVCSVVAPPVADHVRTRLQLPSGYGAEGDQQRAARIPALVRPAVETLATGAEGNWLRERVEGGAWVYDLHVLKGGRESVIRLDSGGNVIAPAVAEPEPEVSAEAGE